MNKQKLVYNNKKYNIGLKLAYYYTFELEIYFN